MMFFPASPDAKNYTNTQHVLNDWTFLSSLVKSITGKPAPMCIDMPASFDEKTDEKKDAAAAILETNVKYATKAALNAAAANNNFYDIAALYLQTIKIMAGAYPFTIEPPTYDSKGLISTCSVSGDKNIPGGQWTIGAFKSLPESIDMPTPAALGNDQDMISFMKNMVPFYNSFIGSFATMSPKQLSSTTLDGDTFAKLVSCMLVLQLTQQPVPAFACTSSRK
jgi:hypothetical protein